MTVREPNWRSPWICYLVVPVGPRGCWRRSARQTDVVEPGSLIRRSEPGSWPSGPGASYTAPAMNGNVLDHLWNGWRAAYVAGSVAERRRRWADGGACSRRSSTPASPTPRPTSSTAGATCFVIMNAFPYTSGHMMVLPYREVADLEELDRRREPPSCGRRSPTRSPR